jgi:hypothetical protein
LSTDRERFSERTFLNTARRFVPTTQGLQKKMDPVARQKSRNKATPEFD